ncbi:ThiF family adenylyltransferase [Namhaeicola litoreus]|uniref:ThiF family adenylyltransferase n=1 Tax=Namhaeicola litoreus TaxID=1052145 RepID=A0ABW3Y3H0_9FLAO
MELNEQNLYQRQTGLKEFGEAGQKKLSQAKIVIVGCGGLGNPVASYLAASGIGTMHLIDFDKVEVSNLHRQVFFKTEDIGKPKAFVLAQHLRMINPFLKVFPKTMALTKENALKTLEIFDLIVDCTDSLPTKYLLNDAAILLNKPLIYGSLYKFDGYVATFNLKTPNGYSTNLRDFFPEIPKTQVPNCAEVGTLNPIVGIIGLMQANEVIKVISNLGDPLVNLLLVYNSLNNQQLKIKGKAKVNRDTILELWDQNTYEDARCEVQLKDWLITSQEMKEKKGQFHVISVIEDPEFELPFNVNETIPFKQFNSEKIDLNPSKKYVFVCRKGINSYAATSQLKVKYPNLMIFSLEKGIENF